MADLTTGPATFSAGARYDYVRIPFENLLDPTADTVGSLRAAQPAGRRQRGGGAGRLGVRLLGQELPLAGGDRERLRRSGVALPAAVRAGRRSAARSGQGDHGRGRLPLRHRQPRARRVGVSHERTERHLPHAVRRGGAGGRHHRRLLHQPRQDPPGRRRAGRGLPVPGGPLGLPQLRLHPGDLPERGRDLQHPVDGGAEDAEEPIDQPVPDRATRWRRATACRWCPITSIKGGATVADRALLLRRRRRPLHRPGSISAATRPTSPASSTTTS